MHGQLKCTPVHVFHYSIHTTKEHIQRKESLCIQLQSGETVRAVSVGESVYVHI